MLQVWMLQMQRLKCGKSLVRPGIDTHDWLQEDDSQLAEAREAALQNTVFSGGEGAVCLNQ